MRIAGLIKTSLVDYPGLVACVLFLPGCNYDCFYCHNPSLLKGEYQIIPQETVMAFLRKRRGKLDAVVISGGEPTLQEDLIPFIAEIRLLGYQVKLDTNGAHPQVVQQLLDKNLCHYYAVDYKAPLSRYEEICGPGADGSKTLETIGLLLKQDIPFQVRTTVIPQLKQEDLLQMAKELPPLPLYVLNPYRRPTGFFPHHEEKVSLKPYTPEEIAALAQGISSVQPHVKA